MSLPCREPTCGKRIVFLRNQKTGANVPVDAETVKPEHDHYDAELGHVSHYKTCSKPTPFSKKSRGRQPPHYGVYACTGCSSDKPTIRDGAHVKCGKCGAAPNPNLAKLYHMPDWPRVPAGEWVRV